MSDKELENVVGGLCKVKVYFETSGRVATIPITLSMSPEKVANISTFCEGLYSLFDEEYRLGKFIPIKEFEEKIVPENTTKKWNPTTYGDVVIRINTHKKTFKAYFR